MASCKSTHAYDKCVLLEQIEHCLPALLLYHTTYSKTPHAKTHDTNLYTGPEGGKILGKHTVANRLVLLNGVILKLVKKCLT